MGDAVGHLLNVPSLRVSPPSEWAPDGGSSHRRLVCRSDVHMRPGTDPRARHPVTAPLASLTVTKILRCPCAPSLQPSVSLGKKG